MTKRQELHPMMIPVILFAVAVVSYPLSLLFGDGTYLGDGFRMLATICGVIAISVAAIAIPIYSGVAASRWNKENRQSGDDGHEK